MYRSISGSSCHCDGVMAVHALLLTQLCSRRSAALSSRAVDRHSPWCSKRWAGHAFAPRVLRMRGSMPRPQWTSARKPRASKEPSAIATPLSLSSLRNAMPSTARLYTKTLQSKHGPNSPPFAGKGRMTLCVRLPPHACGHLDYRVSGSLLMLFIGTQFTTVYKIVQPI